MALELHANDIGREGRPGVWIFRGKTGVVSLVAGAMMGIVVYEVMFQWAFDWWLDLAIALLPLALVTVWVHVFVNGKPESYFIDIVLLWLWKLNSGLYRMGGLSRPPLFWVEVKTPPHPKEFSCT